MKALTTTLTFALAAIFSANTAHSLDKGEQAPGFSLETFDGKKASLAQFKGKVVYLDFWASWCAPCRFSLPFMKTLQEQYGQDGLVVIAVNLDTDRTKVEKALADVKPNYTVVLDPKSTLPALYNPQKMPSSFIIGKDGKVVGLHEGFIPEDAEEINHAVEAALKRNK